MTDAPNPPTMPTDPALPYQGPPPDKDARTMGMLCHLLGIFTGFIGPLIIWLIKKDTMPFVEDQGKEALNFQITIFLALIAAGISHVVLFCFGSILTLGVLVVNLIFCIMATIKANDGIAYRYPINLRIIK